MLLIFYVEYCLVRYYLWWLPFSFRAHLLPFFLDKEWLNILCSNKLVTMQTLLGDNLRKAVSYYISVHILSTFRVTNQGLPCSFLLQSCLSCSTWQFLRPSSWSWTDSWPTGSLYANACRPSWDFRSSQNTYLGIGCVLLNSKTKKSEIMTYSNVKQRITQ